MIAYWTHFWITEVGPQKEMGSWGWCQPGLVIQEGVAIGPKWSWEAECCLLSKELEAVSPPVLRPVPADSEVQTDRRGSCGLAVCPGLPVRSVVLTHFQSYVTCRRLLSRSLELQRQFLPSPTPASQSSHASSLQDGRAEMPVSCPMSAKLPPVPLSL